MVVKVIEAEGLTGRVNNPYVRVGYGEYAKTKPTKTQSSSPVWNEIMECECLPGHHFLIPTVSHHTTFNVYNRERCYH